MSTVDQNDVDKLVELYFKQPNILVDHLFGSYHQFIEEMIPYILSKKVNYFYENVEKEKIYLHGFKCSNIRLKGATFQNESNYLFPNQSRKNYLNYFGTVYCDIIQIVEIEDLLTGEKIVKEVDSEKDIAIGKVPIMVKSKYCTTKIKNDIHGECKYDMGGYFLVNGMEKIVISIETVRTNGVLVFSKKDSSFPEGKYYISQINSRENDWSDNLQILTIKNKKNGSITISSSQFADLPIFILFRALGLESDKDIIGNITNNLDDLKMLNLLRPCVALSVDELDNPIKTKEEAIGYLVTKLRRNKRISMSNEDVANVQRRMLLEKILRKDLLPHLGDDIPKKIRFLGLMVKKLLNVMLGRAEVDDRDGFQNKRIETPGVLLSQLFKQNWKKLMNEIGKMFRKKNHSDETPINVIGQIRPNIVEQGIKTALATGMWGMNRTKKGVAQSLGRLSWIQSLAYLRRVMSPSSDNAATASITSMRNVNNITIYFLCPTETPEGQKIGIVKSLAMSASISLQNSSQKNIVLGIIEKFGKVKHPADVDVFVMEYYSKVFINGDWIGCTKNVIELYKLLLSERNNGLIDKMTTISMDYRSNELRVFSDGGRLIRPIMAVKDNNLVFDKKMVKEVNEMLLSNSASKGWKKLLSKYPEVINYEDIESSNYLMISSNLDLLDANLENKERKVHYDENTVLNRYGDYRYVNYTHCEMARWLLLGAVTNTIPFANHNYGAKNIVNFSQVKQSIGTYLTSYKDRMDISQILYHPQLPVVTTRGTIYNRMHDLPGGENAIVAIMSYTGYNQEDSLIFNQSSIDRGIFRVDSLKKYHSVIEKNPSTSQDDIFMKPDRNKVTGMKQANYDKLNEKGYAPEETIIEGGDIIIGKVSPIQPTGNNNKVYKDNSEIFKSNVQGVIDRVHTNVYNVDGYEMYNVRVRMERTPVIGDKFCLNMNSFILTNNGWIKLKDINIRSDKIATLKNNSDLDYVYASDKFEFDCDNEELYHIKNQQINIICTKNHKLFIQKRNKKTYEFIEAKNVYGKRVRYKKNAKNINKDIKIMNIGDTNYNMDDFLKLLGSFICDGWYDEGEKHKRLSISMSKNRKKIFIKEVLDNMNINYNFNNNRILIGNTYNHLVDYFKELSTGASKKSLPNFVWNLSERQSRILLNSLLQGDGSYNKQGSAGYYTSSKELADDIQRLCLHCGWSGTIKLYNGREKGSVSNIYNGKIIKSNYDNYCIRVVKSKNNPQVNHGHVHEQNIQIEEYINYTGKVGCLEIPETHIFYYKEDEFSPPVWTGNSNRHGQKGTLGIALPQKDMPFTEDGIHPDLIMNPHAIPSRMTISQLIECMASKVGGLEGKFVDGTPFNNYNVRELPKILEKLGYEKYGTETMYCGITGKKMEAKIFIGPTYYIRLKHMVQDKVHSRSSGPRQQLTRQPLEGRARDGGLKIGEMEKDAMVAHGCGQFLKERMMETSDITKVHVCDECGLFAQKAIDKDYYVCPMPKCKNSRISEVVMPYACKLLFQELMAVNVLPKIETEKSIYAGNI